MPKLPSRLLTLLLRVILSVVIVVEAVYLLRRPLLERTLLTHAAAELSKRLDAEVEIGALRGDWLTCLEIRDLRLRSRGLLREVDVATLQVSIDPLALARGDLCGLRRVHMRARRIQLDLTAPGSNDTPREPRAPFDLGGLVALCPAGAHLAVDAFALHGTESITGTVAITLPPGPGQSRRIYVVGCGAQAAAELHADGELRAVATAAAPLRAANLFASLPWLHGGHARTHASLRLAPKFTLDATAHAGELIVDGHPVATLFAHGRIDGEGLHQFAVDLATPGGDLQARDFALPFATPTALHTAWLRAAIRDFTAHDHLLPPAVPRPSSGNLRAHVDAGVVHLHGGSAQAPQLRAKLHSGSLQLADGTTTAPLRFDLTANLAALAPTHLPIQVGDANARVELDLATAGVNARGEFVVAAPKAEADGGQAHGRFDLALGAQPRAHVTVATARASLDGHDLTLAGRLDWQDDQLTLTDIALHDGYGNRVTVSGSAGLGADLDWRAALSSRADLRAQLAAVDLAPWLRGLPPMAAAELRGNLTWRTVGEVAIAAKLMASASDFAAGSELLDARAEVELSADATRCTVRRGRVDVGPARIDLEGHAEVSPVALLTDWQRATRAGLDLRATLDDVALTTLPLSALGLAELRGRGRGELTARGELAAPELAGRVTLAEVDLRTLNGERLDDLSGHVELTPTRLRIVDMHASRGTGPLQLAGDLRADGALWSRWRDADLDLSLTGQDVLLHRRAGLKVRADLDLEARGTLRDFAVTGNVAVRNSKFVSRLPLFDLRRSGGEAASSGIDIPGVTLPAPMQGRVDVAIATAQPFAVETNLLTGKFDAQLQLRGDLAAPTLLGTVSGSEATLVLPGARLRSSALLLEFMADAPRFPRLTANARGRRHGFDIVVTAQGRYDRPDIVFSSEPALPPDELLVLVTTGARPDALRDVRGVGTVLGAYVAQEFADWIFGSDSTEAKESFLDRFTVETGTEISRGGSESIVVEFRISDRLYLQGERDVYSDINMGLVYRLRFR